MSAARCPAAATASAATTTRATLPQSCSTAWGITLSSFSAAYSPTPTSTARWTSSVPSVTCVITLKKKASAPLTTSPRSASPAADPPSASVCYGDITPDAVYPAYVCDEIDAINSDYKVAGLFYGAEKGFTSENPNMPALFLAFGTEDGMAGPNTLDAYAVAREKGWKTSLYVAAEAPHGFALTGVRAFSDEGTTTAAYAVKVFDNFMDVYFGYLPVHF